MRVLVTGSTGFIGSHLCRVLLEQGYEVRAFHRENSQLTNLEGLEVEHAVGDITHPASLKDAINGVEILFHTAAQMGKPRHLSQLYAVTVTGTRNVLYAAARAGVQRVVHTSSVAALGVPATRQRATKVQRSLSPACVDERHTWNYDPKWWPYGYAKYLAEMEVQQAVAQGLNVVVVNPAVVIGAGDLNRISSDIIIHVAKGRVPIAPQGGMNVVHIADVVRGHLAALEAGRTGERYILGGENLTHLNFLRTVADVTGVHPPRLVLPTGLLRSLAGPVSLLERLFPLPIAGQTLRRAGIFFYYNTRKARQELGLEAIRDTQQAVSEAFEWYKQQRVVL